MRTIISILILLLSISAVSQERGKKKLKERILGNVVTTKAVELEYPTVYKGCEMGIKIKIKKSPTYLKEFNAVIVNNEYERLKFRLNIYDLEDGIPNKLINEDEIIFDEKVEGNDLTIDLSEYDIVVNDDFFVSLEWLSDEHGKELSFTGGFFGESPFVRYPSDHRWKKYADKINVGFVVRVIY